MDRVMEQAEAVVAGFSADGLSAVMQQLGYRVEKMGEQNGEEWLRSATGGLAFHIALSNQGSTGVYLTARFFAALQIQGTLPLSVVNGWNASMRFARLHVSGDFLMLDMDLLGVGGMPAAQLVAHIQTWDRLVQGVIAYLRDELPKLAGNEAANPKNRVASS